MKQFSDLPDHSRIWIYQSPRLLTEAEVKTIKEAAIPFLVDWTSHKQSMDASVEVFHNRFVIIAVDESTAPASGCGIDSSVKFIKALSEHLRTDLLDRATIYYKEGDLIKAVSLPELATRNFKPETVVFNNLISTLGEFRSSWLVPASASWHSKFL